MRLPAILPLLGLLVAGCVQPPATTPQRSAVPEAVRTTLAAKGITRCHAEIAGILQARFRGNVEISPLVREDATGSGAVGIWLSGDQRAAITVLNYFPDATQAACDVQMMTMTAIDGGCGAIPVSVAAEGGIDTRHGRDLFQGRTGPDNAVLLKDVNGRNCLSLAMTGSGSAAGPAQDRTAGLNRAEAAAFIAPLRQAGIARCQAGIVRTVVPNAGVQAQVSRMTADAARASGSVAFWRQGEFHPKVYLLSYAERTGLACSRVLTTLTVFPGACDALPASVLQGGAIRKRYGSDLYEGTVGRDTTALFKDVGGGACAALGLSGATG